MSVALFSLLSVLILVDVNGDQAQFSFTKHVAQDGLPTLECGFRLEFWNDRVWQQSKFDNLTIEYNDQTIIVYNQTDLNSNTVHVDPSPTWGNALTTVNSTCDDNCKDGPPCEQWCSKSIMLHFNRDYCWNVGEYQCKFYYSSYSAGWKRQYEHASIKIAGPDMHRQCSGY